MSKKMKDSCTRMKRTLTRDIKTKRIFHMHRGAVSVAEEDMGFWMLLAVIPGFFAMDLLFGL